MFKKRFQLLAKSGNDVLEAGGTYTATDIIDVSGIPHYKIIGLRDVYPTTLFFMKKVYIAITTSMPVTGKALTDIERMGDGKWDKIPYAGIILDVAPYLPGIYLVETVDALYWIMLEKVPEQGTYHFTVKADKCVKDIEIGENYTVIEALMHGDALYYRLAEVEGIYKESCFIKKRFFIASSESAPELSKNFAGFKRYSLSSDAWENVKYGGSPIKITQFSQTVYLVETSDTIYLVKVKVTK
ncbi:MAG: hypothetical protein IKV94_01135 [Clostridia bacterium]|nr:hypothetical protein [Clostridia bacterium]